MTQQEVAEEVKTMLVQHFHVAPERFCWDRPLESLHEDFKILGYLVFLEQLLHHRFGKKIPLLENCSTAIHTPEDVVNMIIKEL